MQCHIVVAAMDLLQMKSVSDAPVHDLLDADLWTKSAEERKDICLNNIDVLMQML